MQPKKSIIHGKFKLLKFLLTLLILSLNFLNIVKAAEEKKNEGNFIEVKILDKVSSKNSVLTLKLNEEKKFENLIIKFLKCKNSEFDDAPDITAYLQVQDITYKDNNKVFIFNGWTFSSSPSLRPFDHPVYDIWLTRCFN